MSFRHLLSLSMSYHTRRKTGEVLRVLDRGAAINNFFQVSMHPLCFARHEARRLLNVPRL